MTRPYPPPLLAVPDVGPFDFGPSDQRSVVRVLGLKALSAELTDAIAHSIGCFRATRNGSRDTTVGAILAALAELSRAGPAHDQAVARFVDDRCGVDYTTHTRLQPLALAVMAGDKAGARSARKGST